MKESVSHLIGILHNQISRDINTFAMQFKLTGTQIQILNYLNNPSNSGNVFQKHVEKRFNIRRSTATNILKNMEEKGLIKRIISDSDSRVKVIVVQESGKRIQKEISNFLQKNDENILKNLNDYQQRNLLKALKEITDKQKEKK